MRNRERSPNLFVSGPVDEKVAAQRVLHGERKQLKSFVIACLRALLADPKGFLARLDGHWPEERPEGRPRKKAAEQSA